MNPFLILRGRAASEIVYYAEERKYFRHWTPPFG